MSVSGHSVNQLQIEDIYPCIDRWVKTQADRSLWIGLSRERLV